MRVDTITAPNEYSVRLVLNEAERAQLLQGSESEARAWRQTLLANLADSSTFAAIRRHRVQLAQTQAELAKLQAGEVELSEALRKAVANDASLDALRAKRRKGRERVAEATELVTFIETALAEQMAAAVREVDEMSRELLAEFYQA